MTFNPLDEMETRDWLIIVSTILGPILAVQAQKAVEAFRERRESKRRVFEALMATRAAVLSFEHVRALNMIDLVFHGRHFFWIHHRTKTEQAVINSWREYHDHLNSKSDDATIQIWYAKAEDLLVNLLLAISNDVGFKFDKVQLKRGGYSPIAHGQIENEQGLVRKLAIKVLSGELPLKMEVTSLPASEEEAVQSQMELQKKLTEALDGKGALTIQVKQDASARTNRLTKTS